MSGTCWHCGAYRHSLHRDHIHPKYLGGSDTDDNIQWLCANCHEEKSQRENSEIQKAVCKSPERRAQLSEFGKLGGVAGQLVGMAMSQRAVLGGYAAAAKLTPEQRSERSRHIHRKKKP